MEFHYRPTGHYFGDVVPFYWQGEYHLFYLRGAYSPPIQRGCSWTGKARFQMRQVAADRRGGHRASSAGDDDEGSVEPEPAQLSRAPGIGRGGVWKES